MEKAYKTINKLGTTVLRGTQDSSSFCHFVFTRQFIIRKSMPSINFIMEKVIGANKKGQQNINQTPMTLLFFFNLFAKLSKQKIIQEPQGPRSLGSRGRPLFALWWLRHCTSNMSVPLQLDIVLFSYDTRPKGPRHPLHADRGYDDRQPDNMTNAQNALSRDFA